MTCRWGAAFAATAIAAALAGAPAAESRDRSRGSGADPAAVRAEMRGLCEQQRASDDPFFGERSRARREAELAAAGDDPARRVVAAANLALDLLRLGEAARAVELLEQARDLARREGFPMPMQRGLTRQLALAHVVLAEDRNCVHSRSADSCILPIAPAGVHADGRHVARAADLYRELLEQGAGDPSVRWLGNLTAMLAGGYPARVPERFRLPEHAFAPEASFPRWRDVAPSRGVAAFDLAGGAVMDDFDGDGLLDLVSSSMHPCEPMKAFRNDGRGGFEDVAARWGLDAQLGGLNLVQTDYDGDGRPDLLVMRGGWQGEHGRVRRSLLRNALSGSGGGFVDVTAEAGLAQPAYPSQAAAWADYDGDGDLDFFVGNEGSGDTVYPSQLFQNQGDGTFRDVAVSAGVAAPGFAKGVAWGDYDGDGRPDLYVSCIGANRLYRNQGDGTFRDVTDQAGVAEPSGRSFATWFFDFDNDGDLDLWVNDYSAPVAAVAASYLGEAAEPAGHPVLYRNEGDGTFRDVSAEVGLTRSLLPMGANFGDLDGDGFLDVYLGTGVPDYEALMPNVMYRNEGGRRFRDVTFAGGFGHLQKGHGIAFGDVDHDGDQDVFEQMGGAYPGDGFYNALYENPGGPGNGARWLVLILEGRRANRAAIGARVEVIVREDGEHRSLHRVVGSGGSFGASPLRLHVGLGTAGAVEAVVVRWPGSGTVQRFDGVVPNGAYRAVEGEPRLRPVELPRLAPGRGEP